MELLSDDRIERQMDLETEMVSLGVERYRTQYDNAMAKGRFAETAPGAALTKMAVESFSEAIVEWKHEALGKKRGRRVRAATLINDMDQKAVAYVVIRTILGMCHKNMALATLARTVGKQLYTERRMEQMADRAPGLYHTVDKTSKRNAQDAARRATVMLHSINKFAVETDHWSDNDMLQLGLKMIELFEEHTGFCKIVRKPADNGKGLIDIVTASQRMMDYVEEKNAVAELMKPQYLPTVIPPKPWEALHGGGYHFDMEPQSRPLVRVRFGNAVSYKGDELDMPKVYGGVNAIQNTAWQINRKVLDVLGHLWDKGLPIPGIPSREPIKIPKYPDNPTDEQKKVWKKKARDTHDANAKSQGIRLQVSMTVRTARDLEHDPEIFFPHFLDSRGRAYPIPSGLTPQGSDYSRGLLTLAEGDPLGDYDGVRWLAIHGANTFGEDKITLDERVQWVFDHEEEILWCAEDPFKFDWWHQADKPFCFLAFCFEWAGYKRHGLDFVSSLPIAQDGTCNGLQHFSAMLRDSVGGAAVNLTPSDKPQDIYQLVANRVIETLKAGYFDDGKESLWAETWVAFGIDRKTTKRAVMVLPYGGTFRSCVEYVGQAVREKMVEKGDPFGDDLNKAIGFLAKIVWASIQNTVIAARDAMKWLQDVAKVMIRAGLPINWTTPSGFSAKQKYVDLKLRRVKTTMYGETLFLSRREETEEIATSKQSLAIAPNFVHSLDATAMMETIALALSEGIHAFAMIHDSFGTTAAKSQRFAELIREGFVKLYKENDVLEDFRNEILAQLPVEFRDEVPPVPAKGTLDIDEVLKSDFFFS